MAAPPIQPASSNAVTARIARLAIDDLGRRRLLISASSTAAARNVISSTAVARNVASTGGTATPAGKTGSM
jgi:hypothetical protein